MALCPFDGDVFAMFLPNMNVLCFDIFQKSLLEHIAQKTNKCIQEMKKSLVLIMDRASCHTAATQREEIKYSAPQKPDNSNKQQSINLELRNVQLWQSYLDAFTTHNSKQKLS